MFDGNRFSEHPIFARAPYIGYLPKSDTHKCIIPLRPDTHHRVMGGYASYPVDQHHYCIFPFMAKTACGEYAMFKLGLWRIGSDTNQRLLLTYQGVTGGRSECVKKRCT